ncbi:ion transporter [Halomarina salina]|uniref:Ion transporter n=1 Tax=Halomarina salina TaxID=1872699 RepID=A0ABD5RSS8_9EURY|nr:ion transporter [Halomarina salina]
MRRVGPEVDAYRRLRRRTYELLTPDYGPVSRWVDRVVSALIVLNVVALGASTVDSLALAYAPVFSLVDRVTVVAFTVEYLARVWSCVEAPTYDRPVVDRVRFASRPFLLLDLLAIAPSYLVVVVEDATLVRAARLLRMARLLKMARYARSIRLLWVVVGRKRRDLLVSLSAAWVTLVLSSTVMYVLERGAQPETFSSIPATLWWGVVTLTTVGYGDVYPVTTLGRVFGGAVAVVGVGLVALPAGIIGEGLIEATNERGREGSEDGRAGRCEAGTPPQRCSRCGALVDVECAD